MSQLRDIGEKLRAAIAVVAMCALMYGVSASGAATAGDVVFGNQAPSGGLFACFKRHMTQRADVSEQKAPDNRHSGKHHCPLCLAAHNAAAVLADRLTSPADLLRAPPLRIAPPATAAREPEGLPLRTAHGARAPPFLI